MNDVTNSTAVDDFDIADFEADNTHTFQLKDAGDNLMFTKHPTERDGDGEPVKVPVTITVFGPGSSEYAKATARRSTAQMARLRKKGKMEISADDTLAEGADFLASITKGFSSNFRYKAAGDASGHDLHKAVYLNRKLGFIADQVNEKATDWENFSKGSATS